MLAALKRAGLETAILSNGSPEMLEGAVRSAGIGAVLDDVLSVESVGVFKPAAPVYRLVTDRFACPAAGAVRILERLGRGGGRGLWVPRGLGQPVGPAP